MSYKITISTDNYIGYYGNVTYYPSNGGIIDLGSVMLPYIYYTDYYYGQYVIYIAEFDKTCVLNYLPPTPTPTPTNTSTPTQTPTQTPTNTKTPTPTPTLNTIPVVSCNQSYSSGGSGVTEYGIPLDSIGGVILFQFSARNVPDKMEIIHNGVKKSTSGMLADGNSGPFDSYGVPSTNLPTIAQTYDINQFIGRTSFSTIPPTYYKNIQPIPSRKTELLFETGFDLTLTGSYDQFVWWKYEPSDYIINSNVIIRVTGPSGGLTGWDLQRLCPVLPSPTPTPTPTVTPTDPPIISLCDVNYSIAVNKGEDCGLYIQGIQPNCQLASLSVGALSSRSGCTIGTYVIDWYLNDINGSPSFTSGSNVNASPDVTVVQPFSDEPAEGGTWFPVIRFAYLNGVQYTSDINLVNGSVKYSPDFSTIIDSVCVEAFTCSSGIQGNTYPVTVSYLNTTQNSTRAERSISWDLSPITKNFAWAFKGFSIYDTISIRYISPTNNINSQIENWKVGFDAGTNSLTSNPKVYSWGFQYDEASTLKLVTSLTGFTYTNGDYLLINVMPNPTISNTNWGFSGKCLTDTASLDCGSLFNGNFNKDGYNFSNITTAFNPSTCNLTISGITRNSPIYTATTSNNNFFKYHTLSSNSNSVLNVLPNLTTQVIPTLFASVRKSMVGNESAGRSDRGCSNQISGTTINKSGSTLTLTFDDITDYNVYKTQYNNVLNHSTFTNYVNDPTNINYYKYVRLGVLSGTTCGDTLGISYNYQTHVSSSFIFDDLNNKLTVILLPPINGYTSGETCDTIYSQVDTVINQINGTISQTNYTFKTYVRRGESPPTVNNAVGGLSMSIQQNNGGIGELELKLFPKPNVCYSSTYEWCLINSFHLSSYVYYFSTTVTDITDPTNNFKIQNILGSDGCRTFPYSLLYEISNGIVIFPI